MPLAPFTINLKGLAPADPFVDLPLGVYRVQVIAIEKNEKEGGKESARFDVVVHEGQYQGAPQQTYVGMDFSKEFNRRMWRTVLESMGADASKIDLEALTIDPAKLIGKLAWLYVTPPAAGATTAGGEREYGEKRFLRPSVAERMKTIGAQAPATGAGATATGGQGAAFNAQAPATPQPSQNGTAGAKAALFDF